MEGMCIGYKVKARGAARHRSCPKRTSRTSRQGPLPPELQKLNHESNVESLVKQSTTFMDIRDVRKIQVCAGMGLDLKYLDAVITYRQSPSKYRTVPCCGGPARCARPPLCT